MFIIEVLIPLVMIHFLFSHFIFELFTIRGKQWTGEYVMEFRDLINSFISKADNGTEEARFSFLQGGYMEDFQPQGIRS